MDTLGKFGEHSRARVALSCSPNFPRASITRYKHAKHEQILKFMHICDYNEKMYTAVSTKVVQKKLKSVRNNAER